MVAITGASMLALPEAPEEHIATVADHADIEENGNMAAPLGTQVAAMELDGSNMAAPQVGQFHTVSWS